MLHELLGRELTRRNREAAGTHGMSAGDVFGRISDDPSFFRREISSRVDGCSFEGDRAKAIPIGMVATVSAEGEVTRQTKVPHFRCGPTRQIASQQANRCISPRGQRNEQVRGPTQNPARKPTMRQIPVQPIEINLEIGVHPLGSGFDRKVLVNAPHDPKIRASREVQCRPLVPENFARSLLQRPHPRTARVDERSIDIKKIEHGPNWVAILRVVKKSCQRRVMKNPSPLAGTLNLFRLLWSSFIGGLIRHLIRDEIVVGDVVFLLRIGFEIVFFHEFTMEQVEFTLALMRG